MKIRVLLSILALGMVAGFMSAAPSAEAQTAAPPITLSFYVDPDGTGFVLSDTDTDECAWDLRVTTGSVLSIKVIRDDTQEELTVTDPQSVGNDLDGVACTLNGSSIDCARYED